jgi:hypothetical protein
MIHFLVLLIYPSFHHTHLQHGETKVPKKNHPTSSTTNLFAIGKFDACKTPCVCVKIMGMMTLTLTKNWWWTSGMESSFKTQVKKKDPFACLHGMKDVMVVCQMP